MLLPSYTTVDRGGGGGHMPSEHLFDALRCGVHRWGHGRRGRWKCRSGEKSAAHNLGEDRGCGRTSCTSTMTCPIASMIPSLQACTFQHTDTRGTLQTHTQNCCPVVSILWCGDFSVIVEFNYIASHPFPRSLKAAGYT